MNDSPEYEYEKPRLSLARFRVWLSCASLIVGLCVVIVGMALGRDGEKALIAGLAVTFLSALRLLGAFMRVAFDD